VGDVPTGFVWLSAPGDERSRPRPRARGAAGDRGDIALPACTGICGEVSRSRAVAGA